MREVDSAEDRDAEMDAQIEKMQRLRVLSVADFITHLRSIYGEYKSSKSLRDMYDYMLYQMTYDVNKAELFMVKFPKEEFDIKITNGLIFLTKGYDYLHSHVVKLEKYRDDLTPLISNKLTTEKKNDQCKK